MPSIFYHQILFSFTIVFPLFLLTSFNSLDWLAVSSQVLFENFRKILCPFRRMRSRKICNFVEKFLLPSQGFYSRLWSIELWEKHDSYVEVVPFSIAVKVGQNLAFLQIWKLCCYSSEEFHSYVPWQIHLHPIHLLFPQQLLFYKNSANKPFS